MTEPFRKILSPVDFDEQSLAALRYVSQLAQGNHAEVALAHIVPTQEFRLHRDVYRPEEGGGANAEWAQTVTKEALEKLAQEHLQDVRYQIFAPISDDPVKGILALQKEHEANLIVMATHGRDGVAHLLRGSVTEKTVRESLCPVFAISKEAQQAANRPFRNILVSVDIDDKFLDVVKYASHLARQYESTVYPMHIVPTEKVELQLIEAYRGSGTDEPDLVHAEKVAKKNLEEVAQEHLRSVRCEPLVYVSGNPGRTILEVERDVGADLLMMTTHGFKGIFHILVGSLTERMVRESYCPVFSVHRR
jgi:nucleotide-binding universal stress UspA family protein